MPRATGVSTMHLGLQTTVDNTPSALQAAGAPWRVVKPVDESHSVKEQR